MMESGRSLLAEGDALKARRVAGLQPWQRATLETQAGFRIRSAKRFPEPENWLWTERSLAQASDWWSAVFKASLFPKASTVVDACCGAGADLVALSDNHQTRGVDSDPVMTHLSRCNLALHGVRAELTTAAFDPQILHRDQYLHVDPDRRANGLQKKTTVDELFSPPLPEVLPAALRVVGAMIKLAPSTQYSEDVFPVIQSEASRMWIGNQGECRQQLLLLGDLREQVKKLQSETIHDRIAVLAEPNPTLQIGDESELGCTEHFSGSSQLLEAGNGEVVQEVSSYLYDLHSVLHASELHWQWAEPLSMRPLSSVQGYYTSEHRILSPWARCYRVLQVIPWDDRRVRKVLRGLGAGIVEVKNRLHRLDANGSQRRYSSPDGRALTLLVTRMGARVRAIVAERVVA